MKEGTILEGFNYLKNGHFIEKVEQNSGSLSLLAKIDDFELMEQTIHLDKEFIIVPGDKQNLIELFYILDGKIKDESHNIIFEKGDSFYVHQLTKPVYFKTLENTRLLYFINDSLFVLLSDIINKLKKTIIKVEAKDLYTEKHSNRVMNLAVELAKKLNLGDIDMMRLSYASLFHDLGKIDIPDIILQKPGKLTSEEFETIKQHPLLGRILADEIKLIDIGIIIEQHHEHIDGTGYPHGLKGDDICIEAKIIAIVDSYDAMTSDRPYRKGLSKETAINELIKNRGSHYDHVVADTFIRMLKNETS